MLNFIKKNLVFVYNVVMIVVYKFKIVSMNFVWGNLIKGSKIWK